MQNEPSSFESVMRAVYIYVILFVTWFFILVALRSFGLLVLMLPASEWWWLMTAALALVTEVVIYRLR